MGSLQTTLLIGLVITAFCVGLIAGLVAGAFLSANRTRQYERMRDSYRKLCASIGREIGR